MKCRAGSGMTGEWARSLVATGLLLLAVAPARSEEGSAAQSDPAARFAEANTLYRDGAYDSAVAVYRDLLEEGYEAFQLHYNLGNAHYKLGDLGPAILHYERAAKLDPRNRDVEHNLELAYLRQPDREIEPLPVNVIIRTWRGLTGILPAALWSKLALAALWAAFLGLLLFWFAGGLAVRRAGWYGALSLLAAAVLLLVLALGRRAVDRQSRYAIIMAPSAVIKSAPSEGATNLYILREGFKLRVTDQAGPWMEVTLADGNVGWLSTEAVEEI